MDLSSIKHRCIEPVQDVEGGEQERTRSTSRVEDFHLRQTPPRSYDVPWRVQGINDINGQSLKINVCSHDLIPRRSSPLAIPTKAE